MIIRTVLFGWILATLDAPIVIWAFYFSGIFVGALHMWAKGEFQ
jgi:hypothetical protein